jgi:hypothetical protein
MTPEQALQHAQDNPIFLTITGSRMYGSAKYDINGNCISDIDKRGIVIPPWEYILTKNYHQSSISNEEDGHLWSLDYFIKGLLQSNPQFLELLFAPDNCILATSDIAKDLIKNRDWFVSKKLYKRLTGFSYSEHRKAMGVKAQFEKRTQTESEALTNLSNTFANKWGDQRKELMDEITGLAFSHHDVALVPSVAGIAGKRLDEFEKYGYCTSCACHALRLLGQCEEMLRLGTMVFPRPNAFTLRMIKCGIINKEAYQILYDNARLECDTAYANSTIKESPEHKLANRWYEETLIKYLSNDVRFKERYSKQKD